MAASVLGKRSRDGIEDTPAGSTRSKKRSCRNVSSDEGENRASSNQEEDDVIVVAIEPSRRASTRTSRRPVPPTKHSVPERTIEISPLKINEHFKASKGAIDIYQDSKDDRVPITPRHRDARKIPITPRHRVVIGSQQTPRKSITPSEGKTSVYNSARRLFSRCCHPGRLVGRDPERLELSGFLQRCVDSQHGGCLYISGPPGTGKSALISEICQRHPTLTQSVINCMSVQSTKDLSQKLSDDLCLESTGVEYLRACFTGHKDTQADHKYLVILDEIDRLVDIDVELLYQLFEWGFAPSSKLILIGIANALDLTDRLLPRLKSRGLKPDLLPFMPYSAAQIAQVLTEKLKSLSTNDVQALPFLHPAAIQFCARKVAAQTGDLRKAFDICKRAIDLVELETREKAMEDVLQRSPTKTPLMENINLSSPVSPRDSPFKTRPIAKFTLETAPKATIAHMAKVTAQAFSNGTTQRLSTLNLQQKAVLCSLAALEKKRRKAQVERDMYATPSKAHINHLAPTIKQLYEAYTSLCRQNNMLHPLTSVEFRDVVSGLETLSLVSAADGKNGLIGSTPTTPSRTPSKRGKTASFGETVAGTDGRRIASVISHKELLDVLEGAGAGAGTDLLREILGGQALA